MIGVQADSLAVAEERIATLNERANELKRELEKKTKEYSALRKSIDCSKVEKTDVSCFTDRPLGDQRDIVHTLENNLSVIEDLYRECFYETAKQENLIEMLRSSYLDVRLMDKQKADHIGRLQNVINTQKWSLDRCQDIALEVDGLKMEISNFLNSSSSTNNDSGMWERSEESLTPPAVHEDLHDVREQLLRLQELLAMGCTCGLNEENKKLKEENEALRVKLGECKEKLCEVECALTSRKCNDMKYKADIEARNIELSQIKEELMRAQENSNTCEAKATQIRHMQELLDDKTAEMSELQQTNESLANKIQELETELKKADLVIKENCKMRSEVSYLTAQVSLWRAQLDDAQRRARAADAELAAVRDNCAHIDACYRQKAGAVTELREHLEAAHARGTALCGEARHAVCAVRHWIRQLRDKHREQENVIKQKDCIIKALQRRLEERQSDTQPTSESENAASCSKCLSSRDEHSCCSGSKAGVRLQLLRLPRNSEMPGCSTSAAPIRLLKKRFCASKRCPSWVCDMGVQEPTRRDAGSDAAAPATFCRNHETRPLRIERDRPRDTSPTEAEELLARVGKLAEALEDGHRRWTRRDPR
ncbi:golgin subfamily A member 3-like [Helicoverpa zea]|uniref:golgin subfamily A member 3-like n=1 Tax=Helicoverpa zea TaxID=7113 RepID=UPI001F563FF9|nr:golgin subfamily A member 3-like [Helicoverpa zea]